LATVYSDDLVQLNTNARRRHSTTWQGKRRALVWNFAALPAGNIADILVLVKIRKGERVLGGWEAHSALSSAGGTATGSIGTYSIDADGRTLGALEDVDRFLEAITMDAAGSNAIANTIARYINYIATADFYVCCLNSVEAFATAGVLSGSLEIVGD
jgi:hypothetical protein